MNSNWQDEIKKRLKKEHLAYSILGVAKDSSRADIRKAFRMLSLKYHPDKHPGTRDVQTRFVNIVNAYHFLTKGDSNGEYPLKDSVSEEKRMGKYLGNEWGYFCWWRENYDI